MTDEELLEQLADRRPDKCPICGERLKYIGGGQYKCIGCFRVHLDDYGKVRDYLYKYGRSNTDAISEATGVPQEIMVELLKEGRFEMVSKSAFVLNCERCGRPIKSGTLCESCEQFKEDVEKYQEKEMKEEEPKPVRKGALVRNTQSGRMRYYNRDKS